MTLLGWNAYGGCGQGQNNKQIFEPTRIDSLANQSIKQVDCGVFHTLLVGSDGVLFATGGNEYGQCGDGQESTVFEPKRIRVEENEYVQAIACGAFHNVLTTAKNKIFVWGSNQYNQCLVDSDKDKILSPTQYAIPDVYKQRS
eukprot:1046688_1